jgi:light-regulated signal transduction histidine kinase (bacteriophytochrome)
MGQYLHNIIIPEQHREAHQRGMKHFLNTGEAQVLNKQIEVSALRKDGSLFDAELSISHSFIKGKHFFIGIINDITIRKQVEETRKKYIEQLAQNKELESFAYIVSHDLKTPMQGIAKIADWLVKDYSDKLDEIGKEYLQLLKGRMVRLESLINGILAYSRAGGAEEEKTEIDLNELIAELKDILSVPNTVKIDIVNKLPKLISSKSAMIQVFGNLIGNAIKHNDKDIAEIQIGYSDEGDSWKFFVKDNGPGIEKVEQEKVFKIFHTIKSRDSKNNSTGIGLGIVKKLVEKGGGRVWVESDLGKGCNFYFTMTK